MTNLDGESAAFRLPPILDRRPIDPWLKQNFDIDLKLGQGTFGCVWRGQLKALKGNEGDQQHNVGEYFAIKCMVPYMKLRLIDTEIRLLRQFGGQKNIMELYAGHRTRDRIYLVMKYFPHLNFREYVSLMSGQEIWDYMVNLLIALKYLHENSIVHRDIKPSNFLYDRQNRRYSLIDFGLSQEYKESSAGTSRKRNHGSDSTEDRIPAGAPSPKTPRSKRTLFNGRASTKASKTSSKRVSKTQTVICHCAQAPQVCTLCRKRPLEMGNRAGTPGYRAPELLLCATQNSPALDIWAAGLILLCLLSGKYPIMRPPNDCTALAQICVLSGAKDVRALALSLGRSLFIKPEPPGIDLRRLCHALRCGPESKEPIDCVCAQFAARASYCLCNTAPYETLELPENDRLADLKWNKLSDLYMLLNDMLRVDPSERYTARDLLKFRLEGFVSE